MSLASNKGATAEDEDGVTVALLIQSLLPCVSGAISTHLVRTTHCSTPANQNRRGSTEILNCRGRAYLVYCWAFYPERW